MILRGNYGLSASGKNLRTILVGVQFVISTALLIFVLFVQRQSKFMQEYPCGYNKNNLAVVNIGGENGRAKSDWLREQLCALPEVKDVAYANDLIGGSDTYMTEGADFGDGQVSMSMIYCSWNLPQVLGLELLEGRDLKEGISMKASSARFCSRRISRRTAPRWRYMPMNSVTERPLWDSSIT